jgi:hypothetical protein
VDVVLQSGVVELTNRGHSPYCTLLDVHCVCPITILYSGVQCIEKNCGVGGCAQDFDQRPHGMDGDWCGPSHPWTHHSRSHRNRNNIMCIESRETSIYCTYLLLVHTYPTTVSCTRSRGNHQRPVRLGHAISFVSSQIPRNYDPMKTILTAGPTIGEIWEPVWRMRVRKESPP